MMTGLDPFETGIIAQGAQAQLPPSVPMLAEILQERGYFTAAADNLGRWFSRGFSAYEGYRWETPRGEPWRKAEGVNQTALPLVERCAAQDRPFFLFLHYWDPHTPYLPPAPFDRMFYTGDERDPLNSSMDPVWEFEPFSHYFAEWMPGVTDIRFPIAQYDASLAYLDNCLAHLFTLLEESRLMESTCVMITADHGEEMDEHGCWFDHHGLYDTNLRVPLIVRCPGRTYPYQEVPGLVRTMDVMPTILELCGIEPTGPVRQGQSILPVLDGILPAGVCEELFLTECTWMRKRGYRDHRFKFIQALEPDIHGKPPEELYDLMADPGEQQNLADSHPELAQRFRQRLREWQTGRMGVTGRPDPLETSAISLRRVGKPDTPVIRRPGV